jgi:hypothetical protein
VFVEWLNGVTTHFQGTRNERAPRWKAYRFPHDFYAKPQSALNNKTVTRPRAVHNNNLKLLLKPASNRDDE